MTQRCWKCGWNGIAHDPACPEVATEKRVEYDRGYKQGRAGKDSESDDPSYRLGYCKGESALEEAQNGCDRAAY